MQSDNFNEIVYFLNNLFCSTHRYIIYIANKMKAVVTLRNKRVHSPQSLAQRRKNSWLIDCIVSTTAGALGVVGKHHVSNILIDDHCIEQRKHIDLTLRL